MFDADCEASCADAIFACEKSPRLFRKVVTFSIMASKSVPVSAVKLPPGQKSFFSREIVASRKLTLALAVLSTALMKLLTSSIIWLAVRALEYNVLMPVSSSVRPSDTSSAVKMTKVIAAMINVVRIIIGLLLPYGTLNALPDKNPTFLCPKHLKMGIKIVQTRKKERIKIPAKSKPQM